VFLGSFRLFTACLGISSVVSSTTTLSIEIGLFFAVAMACFNSFFVSSVTPIELSKYNANFSSIVITLSYFF
jgi:hypothetical protein